MNVIFCHDGPICCNEAGQYYSIGFNDKLFSRYEHIFGSVSFITRVEHIKGSDPVAEGDKLSYEKHHVIEYCKW